jgi:hypothetical protein
MKFGREEGAGIGRSVAKGIPPHPPGGGLLAGSNASPLASPLRLLCQRVITVQRASVPACIEVSAPRHRSIVLPSCCLDVCCGCEPPSCCQCLPCHVPTMQLQRADPDRVPGYLGCYRHRYAAVRPRANPVPNLRPRHASELT